jgi:hypothetical protein
VHVPDGIDVDERAERRHDHQHHRGQLVDLESHRYLEAPDGDPRVDVLVDKGPAQYVNESAHGKNEGTEDPGNRNNGGALLEVLPEQSGDQKAGERQKRY